MALPDRSAAVTAILIIVGIIILVGLCAWLMARGLDSDLEGY